MLVWITAAIGLLFLALFLRERSRHQAAEWDRLAAWQDLNRRQCDYADQAERYQRAIESCRLRTQEAIAERDKALAELAEVRKAAADLAERLRAANDARAARDDLLGFLLEWMEAEVRPLVGPRRAA